MQPVTGVVHAARLLDDPPGHVALVVHRELDGDGRQLFETPWRAGGLAPDAVKQPDEQAAVQSVDAEQAEYRKVPDQSSVKEHLKGHG